MIFAKDKVYVHYCQECYLNIINIIIYPVFSNFSASFKDTETNCETPGSCIVTPYNLCILDIVNLLWVTTTNLVLDFSEIDSIKSKNLSTLDSSKGASTASKRQIGYGFVKKTEKISAIEVKACSPPESKLICCNFFPGGDAISSKPDSNGLSDSVRAK